MQLFAVMVPLPCKSHRRSTRAIFIFFNLVFKLLYAILMLPFLLLLIWFGCYSTCTVVYIEHFSKTSAKIFIHEASKTIKLKINSEKASVLTFYNSCLTQNTGNVEVSQVKRVQGSLKSHKTHLIITPLFRYQHLH